MTSPFKQHIAADNSAVFINDLEFAETHNLNGVDCKAILQNITTGTPETDPTDIVANQTIGNHVMINVLKSDLFEVPTYDMAFRLDGDLYLVESVADDMGILTIVLQSTGR